MEIQLFEDKYLEEMAKLFADVYSEENSNIRKWNIDTAKKNLEINLKNGPDFSFIALADSKCLGGLFAKVVPYYNGDMLFIDTIQVYPEYRNQGVAKELLKYAISKAREQNITIIHLLADAREGFPRSWYEKMGFELSGWAEYEAEVEKIKL